MGIPQNKCALFFFSCVKVIKISSISEPQAILLLTKQPKKSV